MQFELAKLSLPGDRTENQDRVAVMSKNGTALISVVDGMGGHTGGAAASAAAVDRIERLFNETTRPVLDPQGFLIRALSAAHADIVELGKEMTVDHRPRATSAICLVQDDSAYCAHIGDSRIYHLRGTAVVSRSRDHSHVEVLLQEGMIREEEMKSHPMRNYVECCLGGDWQLPDMSIAARRAVKPGDVLMVCSDGLWSGVEDEHIATLGDPDGSLDTGLKTLAEAAVQNNAPNSDNTSAAAIRLTVGSR